ncbi:MAG: heat-inducible transcription repressor HrcA [Chloroflexi bacterium]|jgi:heat-inducible transcriptional repressor|nr:heat-inducible transcription repressor HrcA [Chloroflexota bacterium]MBA3626875.1 heat-inducible transcription repressor HrcA [Chloroflexota bacterium]MBA3796109.1 heat-inducible transcription repressor HrcA [Chloroflexota bacterium]
MARRKDRPGPLEPRSEAILQAIIEEYVATAAPVGSMTLVSRYRLGVSPATVRNVMAELEAAGYIGHPHTSAGRVPTDAGYRLYVETIADVVVLAPVEQLMIRHQFGQVEFASEQWFRLAAATLAGATHVAGLATPAKPIACRVRRVDLLPNGSRTASLVLVLAEGPVKQVLLTMDEPRTREGLEAMASAINARLSGHSAAEVEQTLTSMLDESGLAPLQIRVVERVAAMMRDFDAESVEDLFSEGLLNVMAAPEFSQSDKLRRVFGALQDRRYIGGLTRLMEGRSDVHVFIGSENDHEEMHDVSLILAPYGRPGQATGVIGVLGPTRMAYPHAISTVRYVSGLMNELVDHLYA